MHQFMRGLGAVALFGIVLAGCGGGKTASTSTTSTQASAAPMSEAQRETNALPQTAVAAVPAGLNCGADKPVWVNLHTKAYHESGDPYYGRTKNGQYMCAAAATAAGYHAAGSHASDTSSASPEPSHKKKHHKKSSDSTN